METGKKKLVILHHQEIAVIGKSIIDASRVRDVMSKFGSKYGDVRKYYPKPDVAVELQL